MPHTRTRSSSPRPLEILEARTLMSVQAADPIGGGPAIAPSQVDSTHILVRYRRAADAPVAAAANASARVAGALAKVATTVRGNALVPGLVTATLAPGVGVGQALAAYRADPAVLYAEPDRLVHVDMTPDDPQFPQQWDMSKIRAPGAWDTTTGAPNVIVAVIDTGVNFNHPDLAANVWTNPGEVAGDGIDNDGDGYIDDVHGWNFAANTSSPLDDYGHGTHVAGTIAAQANNGLGVAGVAPNVTIMPLKFITSAGTGSTSDAINALAFAVAHGAKISNNSWGSGGFDQALYDAVASAGARGHVFVAAAGNDGQNNDTVDDMPAGFDLPNILAVAATNSNDGRASWSNYGPTTVDLGAPGVGILSTLMNGSYGQMSGTSMASPHVAGVVALVWSAHPGWTMQEVIDQVLSTVDPVPALQGITLTGGRLDARRAVGPMAPAPAPAVRIAQAGDQATLSWAPVAGATSYNVYRSKDQAPFSSTPYRSGLTGTSLVDANLSDSTVYSYRVTAITSHGEGTPSPTGLVLPSGTFVSDLTFLGATNGSGPVERDTSVGTSVAGDGKPIRIGGVGYAKGLGVQASSKVDIALNGQYTSFAAAVGVDDEVGSGGTVDFQVLADGVRLFDSGVLRGGQAAVPVRVDVTGRTTLSLVVNNGGDGSTNDHADWGNAGLTAAPGAAAPPAVTGVQAMAGNAQVSLAWPAVSDANAYVVYRSTDPTQAGAAVATDLTTNGFLDTGLTNGTTYYYRVAAANAAGRGPTSDPVAAVPGVAYASDLPFLSATNGSGPVERDTSVGTSAAGDGRTLSIAGTTYAKGLGVHAYSRVDIALNGRYATFVAAVGVDDEVGLHGTVDFQVLADGVRLFDSGVLRGGQAAVPVRVDVTGRTTLSLVVTTGGDNKNSDHADWADARLIQSPPTSTPPAVTGVQATAGNAQVSLAWPAVSDANAYVVYRSTDPTQAGAAVATDLTTNGFLDTGLTNGTTYYYRVAAANAAGRGPTSDPVAAVPGVAYVSDLPFLSATNGWGPVERDTSVGTSAAGDGRTLSIAGTTYAKGLGVHAYSRVDIALNGQYTTFLAAVGVDDEVGLHGTVDFQVLADGVLLFDSGVVRGGQAAVPVNVDVSGRATLSLVVTTGGDNKNSDHADWADARLIQSPPAGTTALAPAAVDAALAAGNPMDGFIAMPPQDTGLPSASAARRAATA